MIPNPTVRIELDERCVLFPDGKLVSHLLVTPGRGSILLDAVFQFNETRRNPRIVELSLPEARGFARELVNAAYYAKPSFFLLDTLQATIYVAQHGFHIEILRSEVKTELLVSVPSIWRLIKGLLSAIDSCSPIIAN